MDHDVSETTLYELRTGRKIPILGLGTWQLANAEEAVVNALEIGYRLIDTSSDYGSQPGVGEGIKKSSVSRGEIFLTTKVEEDDDAYDRTESNLQELGLEYIDLSLLHRPPPSGWGEELWEGLMNAKRDGLTRDIGVSNYSIELLDQLIKASDEVPVVNQIEWSPFGHSREMLEYCKEKKIIIMAYSPITRKEKLDNEVIKELAEKYQKTAAQILLRWDLQLGVVPIPKASQKAHLEENFAIFDFELSQNDMEKLNTLNEHYSSLGALPYT